MGLLSPPRLGPLHQFSWDAPLGIEIEFDECFWDHKMSSQRPEDGIQHDISDAPRSEGDDGENM